jgi:hypothetical protein
VNVFFAIDITLIQNSLGKKTEEANKFGNDKK